MAFMKGLSLSHLISAPAAASVHSVLCISPPSSFTWVQSWLLFFFLTLSAPLCSVLIWDTSKCRCYTFCCCVVCSQSPLLSFSVAFILVCVASPTKQKVFCFSWQYDLLHQKGYKLWVRPLVAVGSMAISLAFSSHQWSIWFLGTLLRSLQNSKRQLWLFPFNEEV